MIWVLAAMGNPIHPRQVARVRGPSGRTHLRALHRAGGSRLGNGRRAALVTTRELTEAVRNRHWFSSPPGQHDRLARRRNGGTSAFGKIVPPRWGFASTPRRLRPRRTWQV